MRALIIDDEAPARAALRGLLRAHPAILPAGRSRHPRATPRSGWPRAATTAYFSTSNSAGGTGFDLRTPRPAGGENHFVTAFDAYAARAFEVNALDYLLKPVRPERLAEALRRVTGRPAAPEPNTPLPTLKPDDVAHLKIDNGYGTIRGAAGHRGRRGR
jgi:two-component system LytT family response regulator